MLGSAFRVSFASKHHIPALHRLKNSRYQTRHAIRYLRTDAASRSMPPPLAFAFDIDGVLVRGEDVLPPAKRALSMMEGNNPYNISPMVAESARSIVAIESQQYIQAHTILKTLAGKYKDKSVLVLGGKRDQVRQVAVEYGFNKACTSHDVLAWNSSVWPFHQLLDEERAKAQDIDFSQTRIGAVFVFHDPRDWALDVQIICDIIQSAGVVGGPYIPLHEQKKPVELVFCNPDLIWRSDFEQPRLGQGAFKTAFQAVFKELTGSEYPHVQLGKPTRATYEFASTVLQERIEKMYSFRGALPEVYMVGDNPESDIAGANAAGWNSILVKTGVYSGGEPTHVPTHYAENVEEAVKWAIQREFEKRVL
ncbi:unnamed protein product [Mycena citricolor]|uniref:Uncharacterized protein n=1 Tax=Mycena citricolor TaxID=2018698 RepID=A0AAD2JWE3_9AGAR|nr:unnamed protein product [Mycena citricolor]